MPPHRFESLKTRRSRRPAQPGAAGWIVQNPFQSHAAAPQRFDTAGATAGGLATGGGPCYGPPAMHAPRAPACRAGLDPDRPHTQEGYGQTGAAADGHRLPAPPRPRHSLDGRALGGRRHRHLHRRARRRPAFPHPVLRPALPDRRPGDAGGRPERRGRPTRAALRQGYRRGRRVGPDLRRPPLRPLPAVDDLRRPLPHRRAAPVRVGVGGALPALARRPRLGRGRTADRGVLLPALPDPLCRHRCPTASACSSSSAA